MLMSVFSLLGSSSNLMLKYGPSPASFSFIFRLLEQTLQFSQQIYVKMSIHYIVLGFEPS